MLYPRKKRMKMTNLRKSPAKKVLASTRWIWTSKTRRRSLPAWTNRLKMMEKWMIRKVNLTSKKRRYQSTIRRMGQIVASKTMCPSRWPKSS